MTDDPARRRAPSRLRVGEEERIYFTRYGALRVARRTGVGAFVEDPAPVLSPPNTLDAYDGLGYLDAEVITYRGGFLALFTTGFGGLSIEAPWRPIIGFATSADGLTFTRAAAPLLVPEGKDERLGIGEVSALVTSANVTLFFTALDANGDSLVKRATCTFP